MQVANIGRDIGNAITNIGNYSAQAASKANGVSKQAQSAQGTFNQNSANLANSIGTDRIAEQYQYNAAQAAAANAFTGQMWDKTAAWNEAMLEKQMEFNSREAQVNRDWQEKMMNTAYQRATADMKAAGLNPILAVTSGINTNSPGGGAASVGGTSMGSAQGVAASGGLMNGLYASESSYTGQMEYLSGTLGLISAVIGGVSSALGNLGSLGDLGEGLGKAIGELFQSKPYTDYGTGSKAQDRGLDIYEKIFDQKPTKRS